VENSNNYKIIVSGPVGAGKSTYVKTISHDNSFSTEERSSEDIGKVQTTVGMDYGTLELAGHRFQLFGTPGQERFDYMWEILSEGAIGLVLLIPAHRPDQFGKARVIYDKILSLFPLTVIMGVTHVDQAKAWEIDDIARFFKFPSENVLPVDARDQKNSYLLLHRLFQNIKSEQHGMKAGING
jgi:hypothetical protein